ncbi:hypothetical protein [Amycolatopsis sp. Hca4]|uniref:hypothetical protein n=1 Tax=Amycolatopsis sp. Hca4 TaxID=2742131 RepID=UPI0020CB3136|nr:hypothetical protein [Amycolatopsis sp. Hca4]
MIFRIELRRSIAPWVGLALVVLALAYLFLLTGPWWKNPGAWFANTTTTALWIRYLLQFLWPVVVGAGAIQGMRDSRSGMVELLATTPRPAWQRAIRLAGALGALTALGYLAVFGVGVGEVLAHDGFVSAVFVPVLGIGVLAVVAGGWLGLAVGRLLPHPLTAPGLAVVAFAGTILCWISLEPGLDAVLPHRVGTLTPSLAEPRGSMVTTAAAVDAGQVAWFLGLAVTGFLLLSVQSVRARLLSLLPLAAGVALALPLFPAEVFAADDVAARKVCDGPVCVAEMHRDRLAALAGPGREALALLAKLPGAPTRVEEEVLPDSPTAPARRDPGVVYLDFQRNDVLLRADASDLRLAVLSGAGVPPCVPPSHADVSDMGARMIAAAYFTGELKLLPEFTRNWFSSKRDVFEQLWAKFRALPEDVQFTRVVALRRALLTCQGDPLETLVSR